MVNDKLQQIMEDLEDSHFLVKQAQENLKLLQKNHPKNYNIDYHTKRLHIGCGHVKLSAWINIDEAFIPGITDLQLDIAKGLPYDDNYCSLIHHEHLLEHLSAEVGLNFLKECYRVLKSGGAMRIAMPSLDMIIEKSYLGNWKDQDWLKLPEYQFVQTRAEMLNIAFRWWGHQWLYDREELHRRLREAGFTIIRDVEWGNSDIPELRNLETRQDSLLICEVEK